MFNKKQSVDTYVEGLSNTTGDFRRTEFLKAVPQSWRILEVGRRVICHCVALNFVQLLTF